MQGNSIKAQEVLNMFKMTFGTEKTNLKSVPSFTSVYR